jgi:ribonucleotide monophosphatase NagD (HAD superfamily)
MFGYLIDMDGVIYRGHELIPGALFSQLPCLGVS